MGAYYAEEPVTRAGSGAVRLWLWLVLATILAMVAVGGITRLTGSGLSMVDWRPLMGALPPSTEVEWNRVFAQYQQSPQYSEVNHWMKLADFKRIFFWEYVHRLLGRTIGVVVFVPWLYFTVRRKMSRGTSVRMAIAIVLGGLQGVLGWYMVQSGLVDVPEVSHFRLAAHLLLAFAVGQWVWWVLLSERHGPPRGVPPSGLRGWAWVAVAIVTLQVVYGAFMAGKKAGWLFSTFPDMNGAYGPEAFFTGVSWTHDALHSATAIHWLHRVLGVVVVVIAVWLWRNASARVANPRVRSSAALFAALSVLQFGLGAATVMLKVMTPVAVLHQCLGFVLLSAAVALTHACRPGAGYPATRA